MWYWFMWPLSAWSFFPVQRWAGDAVRSGHALYGESRSVEGIGGEDGFPIKDVGDDGVGIPMTNVESDGEDGFPLKNVGNDGVGGSDNRYWE